MCGVTDHNSAGLNDSSGWTYTVWCMEKVMESLLLSNQGFVVGLNRYEVFCTWTLCRVPLIKSEGSISYCDFLRKIAALECLNFKTSV